MALGKSASGQALGYLYQFERAIFWLSRSDIDFVSIETDDDVVSQLKSGQEINRIYEQDKSVTGKSNPFSNSNINLWKTFSIWLSIQRRFPREKARFVLSTNKRVSSTSTISKLHKANYVSDYKTDRNILEGFYDELFDIGSKLKGKSKELHDDIVTDYSKEDFINLLAKIVLSADEFYPDRNKFKEEIKANLRIGSEVPFNSVYEKIFGWLVNDIIGKWAKGQEGTIKAQKLIDIKDVYIKESLERPFIEQAVSAIPVFDFERQQQQDKIFIKQLSLIEADEDDIVDAIDHFLRASKERDRWAENGTIPCQEDINELESDISRNWKGHKKRHLIEAKTKPTLTKADVGNLIYIDSSNTAGYSLAGYPVIQPYTILGSLHILSDKLIIGWHPDWQTEIK
ncbi:hypothetical protein SAMN04488511_11954 [Pedobacter suwonensis]|uniref:ABC-three component systems C-terminal domain-containing protein n=1 Tax=Pedobacter suwonensis TaxID=332999 RepID=A0A1I0U3M3_9SPHI|nr:ABC-three component system protein [Pedobacter suwonensis]SFA58447.1 hypothetical protein SAMN04488511_11954 [Pedobacter suwonensis]